MKLAAKTSNHALHLQLRLAMLTRASISWHSKNKNKGPTKHALKPTSGRIAMSVQRDDVVRLCEGQATIEPHTKREGRKTIPYQKSSPPSGSMTGCSDGPGMRGPEPPRPVTDLRSVWSFPTKPTQSFILVHSFCFFSQCNWFSVSLP